MAGDMEQVSLVHVLAPASHVRRMPTRSRLCANERSTISARSLKASLATPDNSRVRLLVTARRAAPSPSSAQNLSAWARRSASSRSRRRAPLRPTVSDSPCRSHIRPGLRRRCRVHRREILLGAASVFSSVVRPIGRVYRCGHPAPVSRSTACAGLYADGSCRPILADGGDAIEISPVREPALALAVQAGQVLGRGCPTSPGPSAPASPGNPARCPLPHDVANRPRWPQRSTSSSRSSPLQAASAIIGPEPDEDRPTSWGRARSMQPGMVRHTIPAFQP